MAEVLVSFLIVLVASAELSDPLEAMQQTQCGSGEDNAQCNDVDSLLQKRVEVSTELKVLAAIPKDPKTSEDSKRSEDSETSEKANQAMSSPAGTWAAYASALAAHPVVVKALTSLVAFTAGDWLAQTFVEKGDKYDLARTVRCGSFGLLWAGPSSHYFYGFLDNLIPGIELRIVATKVFWVQVLWSPFFGMAFFSYLNLFEGKMFSDLKTKIKQDLFTAVKGSWAFWSPAHFVNFRFIPGDQRVLYISCLQILYNIFLSFIGNKKVDAPEPKPAA